MKILKLGNKRLGTVVKHLDVFKSVVKQNGYFTEMSQMRPLSFRRAVTGTRLDEIVPLGGIYEEIKREILMAYSKTLEHLWKELVTLQQRNESLRQYSLSVQRNELFRHYSL